MDRLLDEGHDPETPVAVVYHASWPDEFRAPPQSGSETTSAAVRSSAASSPSGPVIRSSTAFSAYWFDRCTGRRGPIRILSPRSDGGKESCVPRRRRVLPLELVAVVVAVTLSESAAIASRTHSEGLVGLRPRAVAFSAGDWSGRYRVVEQSALFLPVAPYLFCWDARYASLSVGVGSVHLTRRYITGPSSASECEKRRGAFIEERDRFRRVSRSARYPPYASPMDCYAIESGGDEYPMTDTNPRSDAVCWKDRQNDRRMERHRRREDSSPSTAESEV